MDASIQKAVDRWLGDPAIADPDKQDIHVLLEGGEQEELADRFYRCLEFGTGGMRGLIGAGTNRVNLYTIGAAAQGLADYIGQQGDAAKQAGVAIAYDCRRMSPQFAERTALVLAGNGIGAYLFERLRPTPQLSFAVRQLGCTAGVVITASHNPPQYNGFKVYGSDGGQITPPHDRAIMERVAGVESFSDIKLMGRADAERVGLLNHLGREVDEAFLAATQSSCLNPDLCRAQGDRLKIVYTSLHGTGGTLAPEALRRRGFIQTLEVPEQAVPDGEFSTVESPNPEEGAALKMGIELAKIERAGLVIGTDPDADRMGIAVRDRDGQYELVSGNRIGALLCYYICEELTRQDRFPDNAVVLSTVVSGDLMKKIARSYGAQVEETLTGFKWIGHAIRRYEQQGTADKPSKTFIFGAEESYGYLPVTFARDKDAITSTAFIAETAAWAASRGKTLLDVLNELFARFGYHHEAAKSMVLPGKSGAERIKAIMERLRTDPPAELGGCKVGSMTDYLTGQSTDLMAGQTLPAPTGYDLPAANVLTFNLVEGGKVIARPSGTEPKIKFYILLVEGDADGAEKRATDKARSIIAQLERLAG
ncbi:MAG: phospho-sugar mutase [Phycisphaerae bacterium]